MEIITNKDITTFKANSLVTLGNKASSLINLQLVCNSLGLRVPRFSIINSVVFNDYFLEKQPELAKTLRTPVSKNSPRYLDLLGISNETKQLFKDVYLRHEKTIIDCTNWLASQSRGPAIRTSTTLDTGQHSFAGVNHTYYGPQPSSPSYYELGIPEVLAGLFKPYSTWYLKNRNLPDGANRPTSLIFCEYVPTDVNAMAIFDEGRVTVRFGTSGNGRRQNFSYEDKDLNKLNQDQRLIAECVRLLTDRFGDLHAEVELLLGQDAHVYITQYRKTTTKPEKKKEEPFIICNLVNKNLLVESIEDELHKVINSTYPVAFVVPHKDPHRIDAFSLIAYMSRNPALSPFGLILANSENQPLNHLATALKEDPQLLFLETRPSNDLIFSPTGEII